MALGVADSAGNGTALLRWTWNATVATFRRAPGRDMVLHELWKAGTRRNRRNDLGMSEDIEGAVCHRARQLLHRSFRR